MALESYTVSYTVTNDSLINFFILRIRTSLELFFRFQSSNLLVLTDMYNNGKVVYRGNLLHIL